MAKGFDFTASIRAVASDMTVRLAELAHIDLSHVAIGVCRTRHRENYGVYAMLTPLRFAGGELHQKRRGRRWRVEPIIDGAGREFLYLMNFYLPRFLDLPLEAKLSTIMHELWHISPAFNGDILVTNNEKCKETAGFGGLNIYDVSNPEAPTPLTVGFGDTTVPGQGKKAANDIHSVFAWDAGSKAYAVIVDNEEGADVDIVDITDPKKPKFVAEYDLDEAFPQIEQAAPGTRLLGRLRGRFLPVIVAKMPFVPMVYKRT